MHKTTRLKWVSILFIFTIILQLFPVSALAASSYSITVLPTKNGSIVVTDPPQGESISPGQTVTVKIKPIENYGYISKSLRVQSEDGTKNIEYKKTASLTYSFTMPQHNITLSASFGRKSTKVSYPYFIKQLKEGDQKDANAAAIYEKLLEKAKAHDTSPFFVYPEDKQAHSSQLASSTYDALAAFLADYPRFFWLYDPTATPRIRASLETTNNSSRVSLQLDYNVTQAKAREAEMWEVVKQVVYTAHAKYGSNTYGKLLYFHDYIVNETKYDVNGPDASNAYGILKKGSDKRAVCDGYAQAFKILCDAAGIPNVLVAGLGVREDGSSEHHRWNYVQLDGKWYAVDTTWDDPISNDGKDNLVHTYFLKGKQTMSKDHIVDRQFITESRSFRYPALSEKDYVRAS